MPTSKEMPTRWHEILDILPTNGWNLTQAALEAGYSPKYVGTTLVPILNKDARFCKAKAALQKKLSEEYDIKAAELVQSWKDIEGACVADFFEQDAQGEFRFRDLTRMAREKLKTISEIKVTRTIRRNGDEQVETRTTQFKMYPRTEALKELGKINGEVYATDNLQKGVKVLAPVIELYDGAGSKPNKRPKRRRSVESTVQAD